MRTLIALVGPSGVGKTTTALALVNQLHASGISAHYRHARWGTRRRPRDWGRRRRPRRGRRWPPWLESCRLAGRATMSAVRLWLILALKGERLGVCVLDRRPCSLAYHEDAPRLRQGLIRFLHWLAPEPDAVFYLRAPSETIRVRKGTLTVAQIDRLMAFESWLERQPGGDAEHIDAESSPEDIVTQILAAIATKEIGLQ